jgi:hypothetical protein
MKYAVCANIADSREQLCQRMHDAANEIRTTPGVLDRVRTSFHIVLIKGMRAHGRNFEHLLQHV